MVMLYVDGQKAGTWADGEKLLPEFAARRQEVEVRDAAGSLLGRVVPAEPAGSRDPDLTREEVEPRRARGGMTLAEFWKQKRVQ